MKYTLLIVFILVQITAYSQPSGFTDKTWSYKKVAIVYQQDTVVLFHSDSSTNIYHLEKISFRFKNTGVYDGTNLMGLSHSGNWSMPDPHTMIVDEDTNQIISQIATQLIVIGGLNYKDDSTKVMGNLLTIFYATAPIVSLCNSLQSGDWTNPSVWSCGHVPTITDVTVLNSNHTITVSTSTAQAQRIIYNGGMIKFLTGVTKIFIKGDG